MKQQASQANGGSGVSRKARNARQQEGHKPKPAENASVSSFSTHRTSKSQSGLNEPQVRRIAKPSKQQQPATTIASSTTLQQQTDYGLSKVAKTTTTLTTAVPKGAIRKIDLQPFMRSSQNGGSSIALSKPIPAKERNSQSYISQPSKTQNRKLAELIVGRPKGAEPISTTTAKSKNHTKHLHIQEEDYMGDEDDRDVVRCRPRQSLSPTNGFQKHETGKKNIFTPTRQLVIDKKQSSSMLSQRTDQGAYGRLQSRSLSNLNKILEFDPESQQSQYGSNGKPLTTRILLDEPKTVDYHLKHEIMQLISVPCQSSASLETPLDSSTNTFRRESFLAGFLSKSVLSRENGGKVDGQKNNLQSFKKSMLETLNQEYATQKPLESNMESLDLGPQSCHDTAGKLKMTRRLSQEPVAESKTTAARPTAFTRVKSKSALNNKQQKIASQQKPIAETSFFDEGLMASNKASIQKQQSGNPNRTRDVLINSHPGGAQQKPKHSMKQILHQSHRKLTELLEKAKETKELTVEDDFVIINTIGAEEEEIKKNSTDKSDAVSNNEGVAQDPNVSPRDIKRLTTSQYTATAAIDASIISPYAPSRPVKKTSSGALAEVGSATNSSSIKTMASTYHKRDDLLTKSAALYKSGGMKLPGPHPKFNQSNRKTNVMTSRHTPKRGPNSSIIQPAQSFTELRKNEKTLLDRSSRVETKQSTLQTEGKDLYFKKINESVSGRLQTNNSTYQRRYQLPMSAKLEGKPIAASQKKPQQMTSYSSQVEQVAKMAASRLQKTAGPLNSQKSVKARQLLISGTESDLKIRSFNSYLPQSLQSSSRVSHQKVMTASPKQSNHTSIIFSQDTNSKKSSEDQNLQMGQYMFVKTPSKGSASCQKVQQQSTSQSKGSQEVTSTVQKRVNPNIIRSLVNLSPSKGARSVFTTLEQASTNGTKQSQEQQEQVKNVFTYAKLTANDSRQQYQIHNEGTAEFGKETSLRPNESNLSRGVELLQSPPQESIIHRISIQSENAATVSEGCSQKQLPLEPFIHISSSKPLASSRPQPVQCDNAETTPVALNQRRQQSHSFAMIVSEVGQLARPTLSAVNPNPPFKEQSDMIDLPQSVQAPQQQELHSKQAESNLVNAMNFHRRTSQQAVMVLTNEMAVASLPELRQMTYANPTVSESDEVYSENPIADSNEANNEDDDHLSGEQRYETDGEEQGNTGPCETLTERQMAPPTPTLSGARTPQHQLPHSIQLFEMQHSVQMTETDRVPNEQENSNFQVDDSNQGLENEIRSLSHYSMQQRRQMNTMMASVSQRSSQGPTRGNVSLPAGSLTSKRPKIPQCDDVHDCSLCQSPHTTESHAKTIEAVIAIQTQLTEDHLDVAVGGEDTVRHTFREKSANENKQKITLHQVLNFDVKKRTSMHLEREQQFFDTFRSRSFVKTTRELIPIGNSSNQEETKIQSPKLRALPSMIKTQIAEAKSSEGGQQDDFSNSLTSFLKVKATKAYEFGEVLVKSITRDKKPSGVDTPQKPSEGRQPQSSFDTGSISKNVSHFRAKMTSQAKAKSNDDQFYTPQRRSDVSHHAENVDTQVMNFEADFEQLDIGEEPIFERNIVKMRSMNIFKDKMSILQVNQAALQPPSLTHRSPFYHQPRAKSSVPAMERKLSQNTLLEKEQQSTLDFPPKQDEDITPPNQDGLMNRYSNTVDFSSSMQQFVPFHKRTQRQTFGHTTPQEEEMKEKPSHLATEKQQEQHHRKSLTDQNVSAAQVNKDGTDDGPQKQPTKPGHGQQLVDMNNRRRSNKSTYIESSLFGNAIESLFGKDSIFGALDQPLQENQLTPPHLKSDKADPNNTNRLSRSLDRRNHSRSETNGSDASYFKAFRTSLLPPPLPEADPLHRNYTLVLDLDETLVHFEHRKMVYKVRPLCIKFLTDMAKLYEVVIFTAAHQTYANFILDKLDPSKDLIQHRLYRQHTSQVKGAFIKDLARLGRPLERTLIIDNLKENFSRQKEHGIECGTWKGNVHDRQLNTLGVFLTKMANERPDNVREHIAKFKAKFNPFAIE